VQNRQSQSADLSRNDIVINSLNDLTEFQIDN